MMKIEEVTVENAVGDWAKQVIVTNNDNTQIAYTKKHYDAMQAEQSTPNLAD
jgi:hypothetical protein